MAFGEDQSKIRKDNAPANSAVIRHFVLNFLNNAKVAFQKGTSLRRMRRMAGSQGGVLDMTFGAYFLDEVVLIQMGNMLTKNCHSIYCYWMKANRIRAIKF